MSRKNIFLLPLVLLLILPATLQAQAKLAVYGTVGGEKPGILNDNGWGTAGTVGLYGFVGRFVAGVDTAILPHVDWRILDFSYGITAANPRAQSLTTGIVLRF